MAEVEGWNDLLVTVKERNGRIHVSDWEDNLWMLISSNDNIVELKIYPQEIPSSYIGRSAKEFDEIKRLIVCKTDDEAISCKRFLGDLMDCEYGQRIFSGKKGCIAPLDLEDMTKIFDAPKTYYCELFLGSLNSEYDLTCFCDPSRFDGLENIFVCLYNQNLDKADSILDCFYSAANDDCMVWWQDLINEEKQNDNIVRVFYN